MSTKHRLKGWWVICLMAGLGAQPLVAAESGGVSRAVEVPPPKGWTPDTPLFHDEAPGPARAAEPVVARDEGSHALDSAKPARRLEAVMAEKVREKARTKARAKARTKAKAPQSATVAATPTHQNTRRPPRESTRGIANARAHHDKVNDKANDSRQAALRQSRGAAKAAVPSTRKASVQPVAKAPALASVQPARKAGKPVASARTGAARRGAEQGVARAGGRSVSPTRLASARQQPSAGAARRPAPTKRAADSAPAPRSLAAGRGKAGRVGREQALAEKPRRVRQAHVQQPGKRAPSSERSGRRVGTRSSTQAGGRASGPGLKKG